MTIDEIFVEWDKDSKLDKTELGREALAIPSLHNKYYRFYVNEKMLLIQMEADFKRLISLRHDFYSGAIDDGTLSELGWTEEFQNFGRRTILKTEIPRYLEADDRVIKMTLKISAQKEKVGLLDSIIKTIANRNFIVKSAIDWAKFQVGA